MLFLEDLAPGQRFSSPALPLAADALGRFDIAGRTSELSVASLTMRLIVESDFRPTGGMLGAGIVDLQWPNKARPGDLLRVQSEILEVRRSKSRPDRGLARIRNVTLNAADQPVQIMISTVVIQAREATITPS